MFTLLVKRRGGEENEVNFDKATVQVGRARTNDLVLAAPNVSKHHAKLLIEGPDEMIVTDQGSTNGTFVNGKRITQPALVRAGDLLQLGDFFIQLVSDGRVPGELPAPRASAMAEAPARAPALPSRGAPPNLSMPPPPPGDDEVSLIGKAPVAPPAPRPRSDVQKADPQNADLPKTAMQEPLPERIASGVLPPIKETRSWPRSPVGLGAALHDDEDDHDYARRSEPERRLPEDSYDPAGRAISREWPPAPDEDAARPNTARGLLQLLSSRTATELFLAPDGAIEIETSGNRATAESRFESGNAAVSALMKALNEMGVTAEETPPITLIEAPHGWNVTIYHAHPGGDDHAYAVASREPPAVTGTERLHQLFGVDVTAMLMTAASAGVPTLLVGANPADTRNLLFELTRSAANAGLRTLRLADGLSGDEIPQKAMYFDTALASDPRMFDALKRLLVSRPTCLACDGLSPAATALVLAHRRSHAGGLVLAVADRELDAAIAALGAALATTAPAADDAASTALRLFALVVRVSYAANGRQATVDLFEVAASGASAKSAEPLGTMEADGSFKGTGRRPAFAGELERRGFAPSRLFA